MSLMSSNRFALSRALPRSIIYATSRRHAIRAVDNNNNNKQQQHGPWCLALPECSLSRRVKQPSIRPTFSQTFSNIGTLDHYIESRPNPHLFEQRPPPPAKSPLPAGSPPSPSSYTRACCVGATGTSFAHLAKYLYYLGCHSFEIIPNNSIPGSTPPPREQGSGHPVTFPGTPVTLICLWDLSCRLHRHFFF